MTKQSAPLERAESLSETWLDGYTWERYLGREIAQHRELWEGVYGKTRIPGWAVSRLEEIGRSWKLLVIAEDWCGDASNLVPIFARLEEASPFVEMRVVKRDENPDLMDRYLTGKSRSIPMVVVLDEDSSPVGRWGPRPAELQEFVVREKRAGSRPSAEIYRETRRWYAKDGGETTLRELLDVLAAAV